MGLYEYSRHTLQTGSLKLEGRFYRIFGKTYTLLSYFHKFFKVFWEISVWCRYPKNLNDILAVTEKCAGFKEMMVEIQYFCFGKDDVSLYPKLNTPPHSISQVPGQLWNDNSIDLQNGRKYKTE